MLCCASRITHKPKRKQEKKTAKKKKKESLFSGGAAWAVKVFWKKILPHKLLFGLLIKGE
jgi:hypothetical protein